MKQVLIAIILSLFSFIFFSVGLALAGSPDGVGPWADQVTSSSQGLTKNGSAVPAARSNPAAALGVAENDTADGTFFSLGFGGSITLRFDNGVNGGVIVVESTNAGYPAESANVEVSADGSAWTSAGSVTQDGQVAVPGGTCVNYVRITDTSDANIMPDDMADGYDVDGVQAQDATACVSASPTPTPSVTPTPTPTPTSSSNSGGNTNSGGSSAPVCTDPKPGTPTLLSVVRNSATTAVVTWSAVSPATHYSISYGTSVGNYIYGVPNTGNTTSFTVGGLAAGTNYFFVVRAVNGCTPGDPSGTNSTGGGQVLGASTSSGGQVLGASTGKLAATGSFATVRNMLVATLAFGVTFGLGLVGLKHGWIK